MRGRATCPSLQELWSHPARGDGKSQVHWGPLPVVGIGRVGQEHPWEAQILGGSPGAEPDLVWSTGSVMVKSPLNRELVATYEVTLSVIDNASDLPERPVSVPNGKASPTWYHREAGLVLGASSRPATGVASSQAA